jgi:hypothetical protein
MMTSLTRNISFMGFLASLLAGCATTPESESTDVPVFQPEAVESSTMTAAPNPQLQPTYEVVVVETPLATVEVERPAIAEPPLRPNQSP